MLLTFTDDAGNNTAATQLVDTMILTQEPMFQVVLVVSLGLG